MGRIKDMTGKKIGRWTVIKLDTEHPNKHDSRWICQCECGTVKSILGHQLRNGNTHSCGCLQRELLSERQATHRETGNRIYRIWQNMKDRCLNQKCKDYGNYGARGITVCNEWESSYISFRDWALSNGYKDNLTLDRINNNGNYEPSNCRWATVKEQSRNTRVNRKVELNGKEYCVIELAEMSGLDKNVIKYRLDHGYTPYEAVTTKLNANKGRKKEWKTI